MQVLIKNPCCLVRGKELVVPKTCLLFLYSKTFSNEWVNLQDDTISFFAFVFLLNIHKNLACEANTYHCCFFPLTDVLPEVP